MEEYGEFDRMKIRREAEVVGENLSQFHFIHHKYLTWARTWVSAVGSQRQIT
jgi:hypothetical protein